MNKVLSVLFSLTILLWAGCSLFSNEDEQQARIIFGKSIDGVEIGDNSDQVINKLGEPSGIGLFDFGDVYSYSKGDSNMIEVSISIDTLMGIGVIHVIVYASYTGRTKDNVGIGTSHSEATNALGLPDGSYTKSGALFDSYSFENNTFIVEYHENKIFSIVMDRPRN